MLKTHLYHHRSRTAVATVILACLGCAGELQNPDRFLACESFDVETELTARCATSACHDQDEPAAGLDLSSVNLRLRLTDVASTSALCSDRLLVDSANPAMSLLVQKLQPAPPCGDSMPPGGQFLSAEEVSCVQDWVDSQ